MVTWLLDEHFRLGESPVWDERLDRLYWVDIPTGNVHALDLATRAHRHWHFDGPVGSMGLAESGRLVVAVAGNVLLFDPHTEHSTVLAELERDFPKLRLNDGKVGPDGAFWVGTMDDSDRSVKEPIGSLYRVTADGKAEKKVDGIIVSNGLAFSPDGRLMYHSDSRGRWIDRWDLDPATGTISNRKRLAVMEEATGRPDGGAMDATGHYWSSGISAQRLNRFTPDGKLIESFAVPVAAPTMPCFAGDDLATLFVTSLRGGRPQELLDQYPLTGTLVAGLSPVAGAPVGRFRDR